MTPMSADEHLAAAEAKVLDAVLGDPCPTCGGRKLRTDETTDGGTPPGGK